MTVSLTIAILGCFTDLLFQLETASNEEVNSDFAVAIMESVGARLQKLKGDDAKELIEALREIAASEQSESFKDYLSAFPNNFGILNDLE